jgi:hypothetical protein
VIILEAPGPTMIDDSNRAYFRPSKAEQFFAYSTRGKIDDRTNGDVIRYDLKVKCHLLRYT